MTFSYNVNQSPSTGAVAIYNLKELLKTAGWVVKSSSDATTYNSTGDQISSGASGANGLANTSAWFRIQCPSMGGVTRELCFQKGGNNQTWRIKYSYSAGFIGGSPGATRVPSASDEQFILGGGTDAAPTYSTIFATDSTYKYHCGVADGADGYMFYSIGITNNASSISHILYMDQIQSDSLNQLDIDGYVFFASASVTLTVANNIHGHNSGATVFSPQSWLRKGMTGETWSSTPALTYHYTNAAGSAVYAPRLLGTTGFDNKDYGLPCLYAKANAEPGLYAGFKGIGRLFRFASSPRGISATLDFSSSKDKIQMDVLILPWNGSIPLI